MVSDPHQTINLSCLAIWLLGAITNSCIVNVLLYLGVSSLRPHKKGVQIAPEKRKESHQVAAGDCRLCDPRIITHNFSEWSIMSNEKKFP